MARRTLLSPSAPPYRAGPAAAGNADVAAATSEAVPSEPKLPSSTSAPPPDLSVGAFDVVAAAPGAVPEYVLKSTRSASAPPRGPPATAGPAALLSSLGSQLARATADSLDWRGRADNDEELNEDDVEEDDVALARTALAPLLDAVCITAALDGTGTDGGADARAGAGADAEAGAGACAFTVAAWGAEACAGAGAAAPVAAPAVAEAGAGVGAAVPAAVVALAAAARRFRVSACCSCARRRRCSRSAAASSTARASLSNPDGTGRAGSWAGSRPAR